MAALGLDPDEAWAKEKESEKGAGEMKGRQKGRPTKWVNAQIAECFSIGKPGVKFEVWEKWKRQDRKLGTLIVSVGGLRWKPQKGKISRQRNWNDLADWFCPLD